MKTFHLGLDLVFVHRKCTSLATTVRPIFLHAPPAEAACAVVETATDISNNEAATATGLIFIRMDTTRGGEFPKHVRVAGHTGVTNHEESALLGDSEVSLRADSYVL